MGHIIAIAGKGGTGKTTVAALLIRLIAGNKLGSVLAVDADPNSNLAELLGVEVKESVGDILSEVAADPSVVAQGMSKDRFIEYRVQTSIAEADNFDILTMGMPEGPGCYCYVNNVLRSIVSKLIKEYDYIVIDNEAGLEHLSRRTTRRAESFVIVSDATAVGLRAAARINSLIKELKFEKQNIFLIINRVAKSSQEKLDNADIKKMEESGVDYLGNMPQDDEVLNLSIKGNTIFNLKESAASLQALARIGERICQRNALKSGRGR